MKSILLMAPAPGGDGGQGGGFEFLFLMGGMFIVMYFFFIRPQVKKQKEAQKMVEALQKGDKVVTQSGIHGTINSVDDKTFLLQVDDNTKIRIEKSSVISKK